MNATKLYKQKRKLTCSGCGLEALDAEEPTMPDKLPCRYCERNPQVDEAVFDFYSETWVLQQLTDGSFEAIMEDPDKHDRLLLRVARHCKKVYCKTSRR